METTKHTPGPWEYRVEKQKIQAVIPGEYGTKIVLTLGMIGEDDCTVPMCCRRKEHANAKIIAAAPELLEALEELANEVERKCSIGSDPYFLEMLKKWQNAKQAIKKATE